MAEVWVVMDEGCQECQVNTVPIGIFLTEEAATEAASTSPTWEAGWRDGGQAAVRIYKMELPALIDGYRSDIATEGDAP